MDGPLKSSPSLRLIEALEAIANAATPLTPVDLNASLGLPKQSLYRLCKTLEDAGLVEKSDGGKAYRPARRTRLLANGLLAASQDHVARHAILTQLAAEVGETVNFVRPGVQGMHYVDRVETDWPFRIQLPVGTHVPFHCTASGKTYLASLPPKTRQRLVESLDLDEQTPNTLTAPDALLDELADVAGQGYALDREEFVLEMVAIAVPILDPQGRFVAALAFHGPKGRVSADEAVKRQPLLTETAARLSGVLFA